jgi:hypothetical protein
MSPNDVVSLVETITGYWTSSNQRAKAMVQWLRDRDVDATTAKAALGALAEQYDEMPSVKQLGVKLAELGAQTRSAVGVGDPGVISRMKARIIEFASSAAEREGIPIRDRLRRELLATREHHADALHMGDEEGARYYRDMLTAYGELLEPRESVA